ncbi:MAG: CvpA family protein [Myxococcota bacterium]|nr:CvpA family protein [Myxococcota bacterium]
MLFDALAVAILLVFAGLGARRGTLGSGMTLLSLVGAYAAGVGAALRSGPALAEATGLQPPLAGALAGSAGFLAGFGLFALIGWGVRRWERARLAGGRRSAADRIGGALLGAARGSLVVVLIGILALWIDAFRSFQADGGEAELANANTPLRVVTRAVVQAGAEAALADAGPGGTLAAHVLARPAETLGGMRSLMEHPRVTALAQDRLFWTYVEHGSLDAALNRRSFNEILRDPQLRSELVALGMVDAASGGDPMLFRREARSVLAEVGPRVRSLRTDPELQQLARDPAIADALERGDLFALMRHPGFQRVVSRALASEADAG